MAGIGPEFHKARRRRNIAIALGLAVFVILVFAITMAKLRAGMA